MATLSSNHGDWGQVFKLDHRGFTYYIRQRDVVSLHVMPSVDGPHCLMINTSDGKWTRVPGLEDAMAHAIAELILGIEDPWV